jgi:spore coat polysaccharide biosynthesis protein SpsF (cytidylyltransferase family)
VAGRFNEVVDAYHFDGFVRVNGDSPLLDQQLIDKAVEIFLRGDLDIVTNVLPRTYPLGQSVEVLRSHTFRGAYKLMKENEDLEHVTRFFYMNRKDYRIFNFALQRNFSDIRLCVDTEQDMNTFASIIARMNKAHWQHGLSELLSLYQKVVLQ